MKNEKVLPVILCGGKGSRLWPLSRASFPKQYLPIEDNQSKTFLQETLLRVGNKKDFQDPIVICNEEHRFIIAEQLREINIKSNSLILEPVGRNTAPAITIAALKAIQEIEDARLLVLPSDHLIKDKEKFCKVINSAIKYSDKNLLVTFGVIPHKAETGFGYIEAKNLLSEEKLKGEKIIRFIEKPNREKAEKFILDKRFTWNSGIFLFKASSFINEIKKREPQLLKCCQEALLKKTFDLDFLRINKESFSNCKSISIDNAIMEKTDLGFVLPLNVGWSDIGSWQSLWEVSKKDNLKNNISGKVISRNVRNSYLRSTERLLVAIGIDNLVVVETVDAILVANKNQTQEVKEIVNKLELDGEKESTSHKTIYRPWGNYTSISEGPNWQLKKIIVKPKESLSLQMHKCRSENWIVVKGTALVEIDDNKKILKQNESAFIPVSTKHRLSNPGNENLILIEVQTGSYLGEDDIIRFEDNYGRIK